MAQPNTFSIVLLGRYAGKDRAVAQSLARLFGRDDAWALQVVGASPIVLLHNLSAEQSEAVLAAMNEAEVAGCQMGIQPGVDEGLPKLGWPAPARIRGRLVAEFTGAPIPFAQAIPAGSTNPGAPAIPGFVATTPATPTTVGAAQHGQAGTDPAATLNISLPCPYTGQKMKLTLTLQIARAEGGVALNVGATAASAAPFVSVPAPGQSRPVSRPNVIPASYGGGINTPLSSPVVRGAPPGQGQAQPQRPAAPRQVQPPVAPVAPVAPSADLEEIIPEPEIPAPAARPLQRRSPAPRQGQQPMQRQPVVDTSGMIPLPDVPVIPGPNGAASSGPAMPGSSPMMPMPNMPQDLMGSPMDLDAFEAKVSASGIMRAVEAPPEAPQQVFADEGGDGGMDDGGVCSVFMGKSNNNKVHQLVAELHGISVPEATRYCQKPIVALAKEVSTADARDIRQRFAALNVNVRITKRK